MIRAYLKIPELLALAGLALAAALAGWVQAEGKLDQTGVGSRGPVAWELPRIQANNPDEAMRQLTAQSIWGQSAPGKSKPKSPETIEPVDSWKLLGIVAEQNGLYALMKPGRNAKAVLLGPGDSLPDGSIIEAMDKVSVTTVKQGERKVHRLFGGNG